MEWVGYFKYGMLALIVIGVLALFFMKKGQ
jgi:hypothetical protein